MNFDKKSIDTSLVDLSSIKFKDQSHNKSFTRIKKQRFLSYQDMISTLHSAIVAKSVVSIDNLTLNTNQMSVITPSATDIADAMMSTCDVAVDRLESLQDTPYIFNPETNLMTSSLAFFEKIIADLGSSMKIDGSPYKVRLKIDDIARVVSKVYIKLKRESHNRRLVPLPKQYIITSNDVVFDLKNRQLMNVDKILDSYDIISKLTLRYIPVDILSNEIQIKIKMYEEIILRIMKDWSNNDEEVEYLLWQIMYAVLQHDNHHRFIVIRGPGGNGKSSYMKMLSLLAGENNTIYANIHQFGDPNSINKISKATRVIIGDDAATNHKLSDIALSNLKSITTGDPLSLPVKYAENVTIQSNALFVQGTNTDISFFENNPALKSRMIVVDWTTTNFREEKPSDITFNLDELLDDQLFRDVLGKLCIEKIVDFTDFIIPESVKHATNEMIESNDTIKQFLDDVYPMIDGFEMIPINVLYSSYIKWLKLTNPNGGKMKMRTFTKSLQSYCEQYEFDLSESSKRKSFKRHPQMNALLKILNLSEDLIDLTTRQNYIINRNIIYDDELNNIDLENIKFSDIDERFLQCLTLLAYEKYQTDVMSIIDKYI